MMIFPFLFWKMFPKLTPTTHLLLVRILSQTQYYWQGILLTTPFMINRRQPRQILSRRLSLIILQTRLLPQ